MRRLLSSRVHRAKSAFCACRRCMLALIRFTTPAQCIVCRFTHQGSGEIDFKIVLYFSFSLIKHRVLVLDRCWCCIVGLFTLLLCIGVLWVISKCVVFIHLGMFSNIIFTRCSFVCLGTLWIASNRITERGCAAAACFRCYRTVAVARWRGLSSTDTECEW